MFKYNDFSTQDLKKLEIKINMKLNNPQIEDVYYKSLTTHIDARGDLTELWSKPWSEKEPIAESIEHVYYNTTHEGIVKGWHVHERTFSQYTCVKGKMQVVLIDARDGKDSFGHVDQFIIGSKNPSFIKIPPGVLKAWKSVHGDSVIVNLLTSSDVKDNYKYPWDTILENIWQPKNG